MIKSIFRHFLYINVVFVLLITNSASEILKKIEIKGNDRIPIETIKVFSGVSINDKLDENKLNEILQNLYETNYFNLINLSFNENILKITVKENPIVYNLTFKGIKQKSLIESLSDQLQLKERTPFNEILLSKDKLNIKTTLRKKGYFFSEIEIFKETLEDNRVDIIIDIELGEKSKIKKKSFIGNKKFKNKKLANVIVSEEFKFWKFISSRKFLNEELINLDKRLLKNFYLNKGYYNVKINSSFAKLINENEFELIYNIDSGSKIYFGDLSINLPSDYDEENFNEIKNQFKEIKGSAYSVNKIEDILEKIDKVVLSEQFESINANVDENLFENKLNLTFNIFEDEKVFIERINIFGNNVTSENVIRNQLEIDEGDPFNKLLEAKSINNIKSLNFFRSVESVIVDGKDKNSKIINIEVQEKPTGEIMAGAGVGTSGSNILFGVKENNFLGKGIGLDANLNLGTEQIKGKFSVNNPNYQNTNKSLNFEVSSTETDRLKNSGYKTNKTGFSLGTRFEYFDDLYLALGNSLFYENLETDNTASARQKTQEGDYFDGFLKINFDYDKRDQKFQTTDGFRSTYGVNLPYVSDTYTLTNTYSYKYFTEIYENNISSISFLFQSANSLKDDDIKLSERLYLPSSKLRGFEFGKVGPKDGEDYIGGNFLSAININATIPQILQNNQSTDFSIFLDVANMWGVDYNSSLDTSNDIRSSVGIGLDWFSPVGPVNFILAHPISKNTGDITETFRFNLGTTF